MRILKTILFVLLFSAVAVSQGKTHLVRSATSLPATCNPGNGVTPTDEIDLVSGGTTKHYICSTTNTWTQIGGASTFDQIGSGANTQANMQVGTGGSMAPQNLGQVAASQAWMAAGISAPSTTGTLTGGSIISSHGWSIQYTLNTSLGESLPSVLTSGSMSTLTGGTCNSGTACTLTVVAPTLPTGYTSYNVYACDTNVGVCTVPQKVAACTAITTNCTFTAAYSTNTSGVPTVSTAFVQPPNVQAVNGGAGEVPTIFFPKADGNYYPWATVEWATCDATSGPPLPCGTPIFTHRTWFSDIPGNNVQYGTPIAYKNSFVNIGHRYGVGTVNTNQDRALSVFSENAPANDTATYRGLFGIQQELDVNGNPTITGGIDSNVYGSQFQVSTAMTGNSNAVTVGVVNASFFNSGTGYLYGGGSRVYGVNSSYVNNASVGAPAGFEYDAFNAGWGLGTGVGTNMNGYGYRCSLPATATKFTASNACFYVPNVGLTPGNLDVALSNEWNTSPGLTWNLIGPVVLDSISHDQVGAMNINASANVVGSITASQISTAGAGFSASCSGAGGSNYTYQLVFVDNNGGQSPAGTSVNVNNCVNPLTSGNPVTLTLSAAIGLQRNDSNSTSHAFQQATRIDVYRTAGPMATGKVGSVSCKFNLSVYACNQFSDTGLSATGAIPTVNTTGGVVAAGDVGFNQSKGQHFNTQAANNDMAGTCTLTSATPSTCTVTFTRAYTSAPVCVATNQTTQANPIKAAPTTTNVVFTGPNTVTDVVAYICVGNPN